MAEFEYGLTRYDPLYFELYLDDCLFFDERSNGSEGYLAFVNFGKRARYVEIKIIDRTRTERLNKTTYINLYVVLGYNNSGREVDFPPGAKNGPGIAPWDAKMDWGWRYVANTEVVLYDYGKVFTDCIPDRQFLSIDRNRIRLINGGDLDRWLMHLAKKMETANMVPTQTINNLQELSTTKYYQFIHRRDCQGAANDGKECRTVAISNRRVRSHAEVGTPVLEHWSQFDDNGQSIRLRHWWHGLINMIQ